LKSVADLASRNPEHNKDLLEIYDKLWERLDLLADLIPEKLALSYYRTTIFSLPPNWYSPENILIDDSGLVDFPVSFGLTCILPAQGHQQKGLLGLRVNKLSQIKSAQVYSFMNQSSKAQYVSEIHVETYLRLLIKGLQYKWWKSENSLPWPVRVGPTLTFKNPGDAFLGNPAMCTVVNNLPILLTIVAGKYHDELLTLAQQWHAKDLSYEISYPGFSFTRANRSTETEARLLEVSLRLSSIFNADQISLAWLKGIEVYRSMVTLPEYSIGKFKGIFSLPAVVQRGPHQPVLIFKNDDPGLSKSSAEKIAQWSLGEGFPPDKRKELENNLLEIYTLSQEAAQIKVGSGVVKPGYDDTRSQLSEWYKGCQICGWRTPYDESGFITMETVNSIMSESGGLIRGPFDRYEPSNCLYLCPRHATLLDRHLIRLGFLFDSEGGPSAQSKIEAALNQLPVDESEIYEINVYVFAWNPTEKIPKGWQTETLSLRTEHATGIFARLLSHVH